MNQLSERLARAAASYRQGDFAGARREAEAELAGRGPDAGLLQFLGHVCCRMGDFAAGAVRLRDCLALDPASVGVRIELARALAALGQLDEAARLCEADTDSKEAAAELARIRGYSLQGQSRPAEAVSCYERVVALQPEDFEAWNNLGNARRDAGDAAGAVEALAQASKLRPDLALIRLNLGGALADAGRRDEGLAALEQAARLVPADKTVLVELSRALSRLDRHQEALPPLEQAARLAPEDAEVHVELGLAHAALDALSETELCYRRAIRLDPAAPAAWNQLALLLESANRAGELGALLGEAEAAGVPAEELGFAHALHARREGRLEEALALARAAPASTEPHRRAQLIGELLDRMGDAKGAFESFGAMNAAVAALPSDPRAAVPVYRAALESLAGRINPEFRDRWRPGPPPSQRPPPVFLVGFPRSGTTLLDTLLMGHSGVQVVEEKPLLQPVAEALGDVARLPELDPAEIERLRKIYFEALDRHCAVEPGNLVIDKMPLNMTQAALIHRLFPEAKFVFAERHPADVVLSCFITNFRINDAMANFLDLEDAARLYDLAMRIWTRCGSLLPLSVHPVRYERMIKDLEGEIRPLLDWLGLPWEEGALDHQRTARERGYVSTASYAQVTEPIYGRASGRWRRYRDQMAPVLPLLAPWAERLGYEM